MAKKRMPVQQHLPDDNEAIISALRFDARQDLVILFIPSHDKDEKPINDQSMWADAALDLLGHVFGGATAFKALVGVYRSEVDGRLLHDNPILVESYVARQDLENGQKLTELREFAKRMGKGTRQEAVGLVINNCMHFIRDFG